MPDPASAVELITEVSDRLYESTESLEPLALDLSYLFPAIARGMSVEWCEPTTEPEDASDLHTNAVRLFRHLFPPEHPVWRHIRVLRTEPVDTCPACGERDLIAVCSVVVEYAIANEGEADQEWSRGKVDDDTSEVRSVRCDGCGTEFERFTLDERGYLTGVAAQRSSDTHETGA